MEIETTTIIAIASLIGTAITGMVTLMTQHKITVVKAVQDEKQAQINSQQRQIDDLYKVIDLLKGVQKHLEETIDSLKLENTYYREQATAANELIEKLRNENVATRLAYQDMQHVQNRKLEGLVEELAYTKSLIAEKEKALVKSYADVKLLNNTITEYEKKILIHNKNK